jgi:mono/diheme cytochrome c family protein
MPKVLLSLFLAAALAASIAADSHSVLHTERSLPGDLEVGGELAGLPPGSTRYVRYEDLLKLPQETYTVNDDSNFPPGTVVSGVALTTLARLFGESPESTLIVAVCYDRYRTNYPLDYLVEHRPLLVLRINGKPRDGWPRSPKGGPLGPYLISHPFFEPAYKVLSHEDEPQIPFGVMRIEFRRESVVFGAIHPRGDWPANSRVEQGFRIARQDCFRCHNMGAEGGQMAGKSWLDLSAVAQADSARFKQIIRDPASVTATAKMQGEPGYDDATLDALTAYFRTFSSRHP